VFKNLGGIAVTKGIALFVWMLVAGAWIDSAACADEAADIGHAFERAKEPTHQLLASHRNLNQMRKVLPASDQKAIDEIVWAEDRFDGIRAELLTVSVIFKNMDARSDKTFVGAVFEEDARSFVATANDAIEGINLYLPSVTNAAALAEATRLRDLIIKLREIYLPLAPKT
jgi:hypothetical protein